MCSCKSSQICLQMSCPNVHFLQKRMRTFPHNLIYFYHLISDMWEMYTFNFWYVRNYSSMFKDAFLMCEFEFFPHIFAGYFNLFFVCESSVHASFPFVYWVFNLCPSVFKSSFYITDGSPLLYMLWIFSPSLSVDFCGTFINLLLTGFWVKFIILLHQGQRIHPHFLLVPVWFHLLYLDP